MRDENKKNTYKVGNPYQPPILFALVMSEKEERMPTSILSALASALSILVGILSSFSLITRANRIGG